MRRLTPSSFYQASWGVLFASSLALAGCSKSATGTGDTAGGGAGAGSGVGGNGGNAGGAASNGDASVPGGGGLESELDGSTTEVGGGINVVGTGGGGTVTVQDIIDASEGALPGGGFATLEEGPDGELLLICGTEECQCSDSVDNDGDGTSDGLDSECTGPFDHDEGSFATGIPGDNRDPKWQDCFFDGNSGAGDDTCRYHTDCITGLADAESDPNKCSVSETCKEFCAPLTPPGCDCFGCCTVEQEGETISILANDSCSIEDLDDEGKCPRCVPTDLCGNECGDCELCVGKSLDDLPETCFEDLPPPSGSGGSGAGGNSSGGSAGDPPPANTCDFGRTACSTSSECGPGDYCRLGCCAPLIR